MDNGVEIKIRERLKFCVDLLLLNYSNDFFSKQNKQEAISKITNKIKIPESSARLIHDCIIGEANMYVTKRSTHTVFDKRLRDRIYNTVLDEYHTKDICDPSYLTDILGE